LDLAYILASLSVPRRTLMELTKDPILLRGYGLRFCILLSSVTCYCRFCRVSDVVCLISRKLSLVGRPISNPSIRYRRIAKKPQALEISTLKYGVPALGLC